VKPLTVDDARKARDNLVAGCYPGTVVAIGTDPDTEGKIQIRVDQLYGAADEEEKIEDGDLPFARPAFPVTGSKSGAPWVPPVGSGVWVMFWAGKPQFPVWFGGYYGVDDVPTEFSSSYSPDPKTRLVKTDNGHTIEMRWKDGESEIRVESELGSKLRIVDSTALGGPKIEAETPTGYKFTLDELLKKAAVETPLGQSVELLDTPPGTIAATTPGVIAATAGGAITATAGGALTATAVGPALISAAGVTMTSTGGAPTVMTGGGTLTSTYTGVALYTFLGALTYVVAGLYALTALGLTITGAALAIVTTGTPILVGSLLGVKRKLANDQLMVLVAQLLYAYENHGHPLAPGVPTLLVSTQVGLVPNPLTPLINYPAGTVSLDASTMVTQNVQAD